MRDLHNKLKIGVVLSKKEYAYTTGTLGPVLDTIYYTYGNSNWGDLLTSYDGKSITYDAWSMPLTTVDNTSFDLGDLNPLRYRGYVYDHETGLTEVKSVKYISNTQQLRDFADYANATGRSLELYVRPTTKVAQTVIDAGWDIKYLW